MAEERVHLSKTEPEAYKALAAFSATVGRICADSGIDDQLKELVMLRSSQMNGCAYCVHVHTEQAAAAGLSTQRMMQVATWQESTVFSDRERAALELAEEYVNIGAGGIRQEVYDRVGSVFTEKEYAALSWACVSINAFNRVAIAGHYAIPEAQA